MEGCAFCSIVAGQGPASFIHRDDVVVAFLSHQPVNRGHALVVPREHVTCLAEMDEATGEHLFRVTMRVAAAIRRAATQYPALRADAVRLVLSDGRAAGQEMMHVHMHVIPRYSGDGGRGGAMAGPRRASRADLDATAEEIVRAYRELYR